MYCCKNFNSLSVLSLYEGELLGSVDKLYFDKNLKKLIAIELLGEDGVKFCLPTKNIYHVGKNAITVRNNQAISLQNDFENLFVNPTSLKAYTITGEFIGIINEIYFNEKFLTEKIEFENGKNISPNMLASSSKNTLIFYEKENKIDVKKFTPNKNKKVEETSINKQTNDVMENKEIEEKTEIKPEKKEKNIVQLSDFLVGRICTKDIFNFNNEILIKAQSVITKKSLKEITRFGKLRELMLFSK